MAKNKTEKSGPKPGSRPARKKPEWLKKVERTKVQREVDISLEPRLPLGEQGEL